MTSTTRRRQIDESQSRWWWPQSYSSRWMNKSSQWNSVCNCPVNYVLKMPMVGCFWSCFWTSSILSSTRTQIVNMPEWTSFMLSFKNTREPLVFLYDLRFNASLSPLRVPQLLVIAGEIYGNLKSANREQTVNKRVESNFNILCAHYRWQRAR